MTLTALLDDALRAEQAQRPSYKRHFPFVASDALACWRQRWYKAHDFAPDPELAPDARGILAMDVGSYLHSRLQDALGTLEGVEIEVPWRTDVLGGRADLVVRPPATEELPGCPVISRSWVGEIKTMAGRGFLLAARSGPEPRHVRQALHSAYQLAEDDEFAGVWIIYVSRDSLETRDWWVPWTHELVTSVEEELSRIEQLAASPTMPHRVIPGVGTVRPEPVGAAPWQCRYCTFRLRCVQDGE